MIYGVARRRNFLKKVYESRQNQNFGTRVNPVQLIALPYAFENAIKQLVVGTHGLLLIVIEMSNYKGAYARV